MRNFKSRSFGSFSRIIYYAEMLIEEILLENMPEVKRLLEKAVADPNTVVPERGAAPLHLMAGMENEDFGVAATTVALLAGGGDPNVRSEEGLTPVHVAAAWGRVRVLEVLLRSGGDPNLLDYRSLTAEDYAFKERQWAVFGVLADLTDVGQNHVEASKLRMVQVQKHRDDLDECSWLNNFSDRLRLDQNAIRKIRDHRWNTRVYECPKTTEVTPVEKNMNKLDEKAVISTRDQHWIPCSYEYPTTPEEETANTEVNRAQRNASKLDGKLISTIREQRWNPAVYECSSTTEEEPHYTELTRAQRNLSGMNKKATTDDNRLTLYERPSTIEEEPHYTELTRAQRNLSGMNKKATTDDNRLTLYERPSTIEEEYGTSEVSRPQRTINKLKKKAIRDNQWLRVYERSTTTERETQRAQSDISKLNEKAISTIRDHWKRRFHDQGCSRKNNSEACAEPPQLPKRNKRRHCRRTESEMFVCEFAEASFKTDLDSTNHTSRSITSDVERKQQSKILCRMSRIFLFMLKKRHVYERLKV